jgi:predicted CoA-binding protein
MSGTIGVVGAEDVASIARVSSVRIHIPVVDLFTVGTAFPAHRIEQAVATGSLAAMWDQHGARIDAMERLHRSAGIVNRPGVGP